MGILQDLLRYSEIAARVLLVVLCSPASMFRSGKLVYNLQMLHDMTLICFLIGIESTNGKLVVCGPVVWDLRGAPSAPK